MAVLDSFQRGREAAGGGRAAGVSQGLDTITAALVERLKASRQKSATTRMEALKTVFEENPAAAYSILGMGVPPDVTKPPTGSRPTKFQKKNGSTTTTYETPKPLDAQSLFKEYNKYITEVEKNESILRLSPGYQARPLPTFDQWLSSTGFANSEVLKAMQAIGTNGKSAKEQGGPSVTNIPDIEGDQVLMQAPDGTVWPVHKSKVEAAKARGLKPFKAKK